MIGATVSHYRVLERLGGGGMGVVYKAEDTRLRRFVALKFLAPEVTDQAAVRERFTQEAQAAGSLDHPNICTIHGIEETADGQVFIAMAYVDGESLRARIARGPASAEEAVSIAIQAAAGLAQAHGRGIVHRDVKPANLMVTSAGQLKIVDFGLASLAGHAHLTATGRVVGTAAYMSPEQARGAVLDRRSDIWSLGVVLYELLAGQRPFRGESDPAVLYAIVHDSSRPLAEIRPELPPALLACVARCLAKDPEARYQSAHELIADLEPVRRDLGLATPATVLELESDRSRTARRQRSRWLRAAARPAIAVPAAAVVAAALALAATTSGRRWAHAVLRIPAVPAQQHIAVLPFDSVGDDPANRAFCDGLTEILTSQLTEVGGFQDSLWVVPQSELRARAIKAPSDALRIFGTNLALTGSVQRGHQGVRLALNLVDAKRARQLRSEVIDEPLASLSSLEDRVLSAVMSMLELELGPEARSRITAGGSANSEAQDTYLRAVGSLHNSLGPSDPRLAVTLLEHALALDPSFTLARAALGEAYLALYQTNKDPAAVAQAVAACRAAERQDRSLPQVHVTLGLIAMATGRYEDAVGSFEGASKENPGDAQTLVELGRAYSKLHKDADAEAAYRKALGLKPDYWLGYSRLARFCWLHGRYDEADRLYRRALALTPENYLLLTDLGALYFDLSRFDEARAMFERSVRAKPNYIAYSNLGTLASRRGDAAAAAAMFEKALALDDRDYVLWGNLGAAYRALPGDGAKARTATTKAIALAESRLAVDARDPQVLVDLASYHAALAEPDRARRYVAEVETAARKQPDLARQLAEVFVDLGDRERALDWVATALRIGYPAEEIATAPALRTLAGDPRFAALVKGHTHGAAH